MWVLLPIISLLIHSIVGKPAIRGTLSDITQLDNKSNGILYNWGERSAINALKKWKGESVKTKRTKRQSERDVPDEREGNSNFDKTQDSERFNYNRGIDSNVRIVERKRKGTGSWFKRLIPEFEEFPSRENNDLMYWWGDVKMSDRKPIRQSFYAGSGKRGKSDSPANILNRTVREKSEKKEPGWYMWAGKRADQELDGKRFILMVQPSPIGANISGIAQDGIASEEEIGRIANKNNVARKKSILRINNENDYAQKEEVTNNDNDWIMPMPDKKTLYGQIKEIAFDRSEGKRNQKTRHFRFENQSFDVPANSAKGRTSSFPRVDKTDPKRYFSNLFYDLQ